MSEEFDRWVYEKVTEEKDRWDKALEKVGKEIDYYTENLNKAISHQNEILSKLRMLREKIKEYE